jgi:hypothetical protein
LTTITGPVFKLVQTPTLFEVPIVSSLAANRPDFWWDLTNDVMFGFYKPFMNRVDAYVNASILYMNAAKEQSSQNKQPATS